MNRIALWCLTGVISLAVGKVALAGPIHDAAKIGDIRKMSALIEANPSIVNSEIEWGHTPLHYAAENGRAAAVKLLIKHKANVNSLQSDNCTPLHIAGNVEVARLLVEAGANLRLSTDLGTPLYWAIAKGRMDVAKYLRTKVTMINIFEAAGLGETATVKRLLQSDPRLATVVEAGTASTPLHLAANADIARLLLDRGADINAITGYDSYPINEAAGNGYTDVVELLLKKNVDIETSSQLGATPLMHAVSGGRVSTVKFLLAKGANPNSSEGESLSVLREAATYGNTTIAKMLISHGAEVNSSDAFGYTPLMEASARGHTSMARLLVEKGANVSAKSNSGLTALHVASARGSQAIVDLILSKDANVNAKTIEQDSVMTLNGKYVNIPTATTPLRVATMCKNAAVAKLLRERGGKL